MAGQAPQHCRYYYSLVISYVSGLDTTLKFAYKDLTLVRANYDFTPEQAAPNLLPLKAGDVLAIVGSIQVRCFGSSAGILKDKTLDDYLMQVSNDYNQNVC